jgi:hypothetical protein
MSDSQPDQLLPPGCGLFFSWLILTILGAGIGWAAGWLASFHVPGQLATMFLGIVFGAVLGLFQWLPLRGHLNKSILWVILSSLGWGIGFPIGALFAQRFGLTEATFGLAVGIVAGFCVGLFQWIYLRRQLSGAGWWILANAFVWGWSLVFYRPGVSAIGAFYGALSGIVTGITMMWLIYRPIPDQGGR